MSKERGKLFTIGKRILGEEKGQPECKASIPKMLLARQPNCGNKGCAHGCHFYSDYVSSCVPPFLTVMLFIPTGTTPGLCGEQI